MSQLTALKVEIRTDTAYVKANVRLVIPARLRRKLDIRPGTKVCFVELGNEILFQPITKEYIRGMSGMPSKSTPVTKDLLGEWKRDRERLEDPLIDSIRHTDPPCQ